MPLAIVLMPRVCVLATQDGPGAAAPAAAPSKVSHPLVRLRAEEGMAAGFTARRRRYTRHIQMREELGRCGCSRRRSTLPQNSAAPLRLVDRCVSSEGGRRGSREPHYSIYQPMAGRRMAADDFTKQAFDTQVHTTVHGFIMHSTIVEGHNHDRAHSSRCSTPSRRRKAPRCSHSTRQ